MEDVQSFYSTNTISLSGLGRFANVGDSFQKGKNTFFILFNKVSKVPVFIGTLYIVSRKHIPWMCL